jgi:Chromate transporter
VAADLLFFFFKTGLLVFGSGLVIVPFLKAQVVDQYHWFTNQQFLDFVAIGMISPGDGRHHGDLRRLPKRRIPGAVAPALFVLIAAVPA